jgi:BirA family biotin operon repressor/biotin-[acetyl-CoA-carboxylase] ligase
MFTERSLRKGLDTRAFGNKIYTFESVDSTNNCAKAVAAIGAEEGTIIITEHQTAGRGRLGRTWQAEPNQNLMFSLVLKPNVPPETLNLLPLYVAVAISDAIERTTGLKLECKWPNDLLHKGKKIAGILIEGSVKQNAVEYVVIGVGINVNQTAFDGELLARASSLRNECNREIDRTELFRQVIKSLETGYLDVAKTGFQSVVPQWLSRTSMLNRTVSVSQQGTIISGVMKGLSPDGGLVLQNNGTETTVFAGDVTVVQA